LIPVSGDVSFKAEGWTPFPVQHVALTPWMSVESEGGEQDLRWKVDKVIFDAFLGGLAVLDSEGVHGDSLEGPEPFNSILDISQTCL
jgi:hypothetical protein